MNNDIQFFNSKKQEYSSSFVKMQSDFERVNLEILELAQKQEYIEKKWHPEIIYKVNKWHEIVQDERIGHDLIRSEIIEELAQMPDV